MHSRHHPLRNRFSVGLAAAFVASSIGLTGLLIAPASATTPTTVNLYTAAPFAVLAGTTITNTGATTLSGDLGLTPGSAVTGSPVVTGSTYIDDPVAVQAQSDLTTAYNDAAGRTATATVSALGGGQTLTSGVYHSGSGISLAGTLVLDGQNNPNSVFIFQAGSTLITASSSTVSLINGAQACNVFWQVGSSATLGTGTTFAGTILALTSASIQTGSTVAGRVLARNGQVSFDTNTVTVPTTCLSPSATITTTTSASSGTGGSGGSNGPGGSSVIPTGGPATGAGGASHSSYGSLVIFGGLALVGSGLAVTEAIRRRRMVSGASRPRDNG